MIVVLCILLIAGTIVFSVTAIWKELFSDDLLAESNSPVVAHSLNYENTQSFTRNACGALYVKKKIADEYRLLEIYNGKTTVIYVSHNNFSFGRCNDKFVINQAGEIWMLSENQKNNLCDGRLLGTRDELLFYLSND